MKSPGPHKQYWLRCLIALFVLLLPGFPSANVPGEYDVKIVYLYNFTKFVSWPDAAFTTPDSPLNICILGELPSADATQSLQNKKSRNHDISVTLLPRQYNGEQCHILFITKTIDYAVSRKIVRELKKPTLVVGETAGFAKNDGVIGFVLDDRHRVRIEVNMINAKQQNLNIRAQLLEIARKVYREEEDA